MSFTHDLGSGWTVEAPDGISFRMASNGAWAGRDPRHVIVAIVANEAGDAWGEAYVRDEAPGELVEVAGIVLRLTTNRTFTEQFGAREEVDWTHVRAAKGNAGLTMSIANRGPKDAAWHESVWRSLRCSRGTDDNGPPGAAAGEREAEQPKKGFLGRLRGR